MKARFLLGGLSLLLAATTAQAQPSPELTMEIYNSNTQALTSSLINKSMLDAAVRRNNASRGSSGAATGRGATSAARPAASVSTAYVPTAALRQQTVRDYVGRLKASNPTGAQAVSSIFGPGKYDYGQVYRGIVDGTGLRENDAADVLAVYMILGWMITNNVQDDKAITVPMAQGVRAQVAPLLATNAQARGRVAQLGEEMKLQAVIVQGGWQSAIKEGKLATYRQGIANMFKTQYGLDLAALKLTSQGFGPK